MVVFVCFFVGEDGVRDARGCLGLGDVCMREGCVCVWWCVCVVCVCL